jgi:hypothetical protein
VKSANTISPTFKYLHATGTIDPASDDKLPPILACFAKYMIRRVSGSRRACILDFSPMADTIRPIAEMLLTLEQSLNMNLCGARIAH